MERLSKETVIYGGAFNPPTHAHEAILQACVDYADPRDADVWLLPSANREDKTIDTVREHRLELCRALVNDVLARSVVLEVCTSELDRSVMTETYDTVQELAAMYPERSFTWVFGADSIETMPTWDQGDWLRNNLSMLAVERPGSATIQFGANVTRLAVQTQDVSSTEVRRRMNSGQSYRALVGTSVASLLGRTVLF